MDVDFRNSLIFTNILVICFVGLLIVMSFQNHICRVEAIKAGMKADEITKACRG